MDRHHLRHTHNHNNQVYPYPVAPHPSTQSQNYHHHHQQQTIFNNNHHGISNNPTYDQLESNSLSPSTKQHYHHLNYPANYPLDQHLAPTYRSNIRPEQPNHLSSPPPPMMDANSIYKILCITNISPEVGDGPLKEAISHEFSRFGDISVGICHDGGERLVYIYFRSYEDAREARHSKSNTILFDRPIDIEPIYEPKPSPIHSPQAPIFPARRSETPPEYYHADNGSHHIRRQIPTGAPPPGIQHDIRGPTPPSYQAYSIRYPSTNRTAHPTQPVTNSLPYSPERPHPEPSPYPPVNHHLSPFSSPGGDHRQYPAHAPPHPSRSYQSSVPPYGVPSYRERERVPSDMYFPRGARVDQYHGPEHRLYPPPLAPPSTVYSRGSPHPSGGYPHIDPVAHYRTSTMNPMDRRSYPYPPAGPGYPHHRFAGRDFPRRDKFRDGVHLHDREESKPSRVIFVSNIDPTKLESDIREMFEVFGIIEDIEVKKVGPNMASALIRFSSMDCAYKAKSTMDRKYIGSSKCTISYGKVDASRRLWLGGLGSTTTLELLDEEFSKFGLIINLDYISGRPYGYIEYETPNQAQFAVMHLKGTQVAGSDKRIRMEYVDSTERKDGSVKNDYGAQTTSKASKYRGNDLWNNDVSEIVDSVGHKRSLTPTELNSKRVPPANHDPETGYYDSTNRASTSSMTKSSNRSSPSSPAIERSSVQDSNGDASFSDRLHQDDPVDKNCSPKKEKFVERIYRSTTIDEIVDHCEASWNAQLILRSFNFPSTMFMCSGQQDTINNYISPIDGETSRALKITQRWRLSPNQPKVEDVKNHMKTSNLGIFIIKSRLEQSPVNSQDSCKTPQGNTTLKQNGEAVVTDATISDKVSLGDNSMTQPRPLKNLISYLEQKQAAGVISVTYSDSEGEDHQKLLYIFPPSCEHAPDILKTVAPKLGSEEFSKDEFLIGVLIKNVAMETKG